MTGRGLVLSTLAAVALGAAWWWFATGLSAKERATVGSWRTRDAGGCAANYPAVLATDRRYWVGRSGQFQLGDQPPVRWSVSDGVLTYDFEPNPIRRLLRPVACMLRLQVEKAVTYRIEVADSQLVFVQGDGSRIVCERAED
jgi:hypothetical protein